jgi:hypothetical protein
MIYPITCPNCHARLRVRTDDPAQSFTCPRCLTQVSAAAHGIQAEGRGASSSGPGPMTGRIQPPADVDVRHDGAFISAGLLILGVLGVAAVFLTYHAGLSANRPDDGSSVYGLGAVAAGGLFIVGSIGFFIDTLVRRWHRGGAARIVLAVLLSVAVAVTVPLALGILFFFACLAGLNKHW